MKIIDVHNELNVVELLVPDSITATATGSAVDIQGYQGKLKATQHAKQGTGTNPTLNGKIQDSADGSTGWADIAGETFTEVTDSADAIEAIGVDTRACKRYIRYVGTLAGTNPVFDVGASFVGQKQIM